jgi:uncharacterized membrane protein (GlpM family)
MNFDAEIMKFEFGNRCLSISIFFPFLTINFFLFSFLSMYSFTFFLLSELNFSKYFNLSDDVGQSLACWRVSRIFLYMSWCYNFIGCDGH